jgi:hypothetical protein
VCWFAIGVLTVSISALCDGYLVCMFIYLTSISLCSLSLVCVIAAEPYPRVAGHHPPQRTRGTRNIDMLYRYVYVCVYIINLTNADLWTAIFYVHIHIEIFTIDIDIRYIVIDIY